jgi:endonuclease YncB( thermonuclease family)
MRHPPFSAFAHSRRGNLAIGAVATFALGVVAGGFIRPTLMPQAAAVAAPGFADAQSAVLAQPDTPLAHRLDPSLVYPIEVIRIIDGDTFEARVRVWPGLDVETHVRLRGIDAAELHARCGDELAKAQAARTALQTILAEGGISISRVGVDKYGGRIDATVATRSTADVALAMLNGGFARAYGGGKRGSWCG